MFKPNIGHNQNSLFESTAWMDPKVRAKLEKSWAPIFYEHVFCEIDEMPFAVLYATTGKPNFPVNILLALEYIKHMKGCNDSELLDSFWFDYQVNYAVGIRTLGELNLAERTLYYFRERVYDHCFKNPGADDLLFGQFVGLLKNFAEKAGVSFDEQRTDTTMFMSNIKKAGRLSLAYDVLIKAVKAIPEGVRPESLAGALEPRFKTDVLYLTKAPEAEGKLAVILGLCSEAAKILGALPGMAESDELRIVERFLTDQGITDEDGRITPKPNAEIESGSLQSAYDEDATFRNKAGVKQSGYTLDLSETCGKDNPFQLITDYAVNPNNVSDVAIIKERLPIIKENTGCKDMYADGGFHADDVHEIAEENGIEIHLTNMTGTKPTAKLPIDDFEIDDDTDIIIKCPNGQTPTRAGVSNSQTTAHFPHEICAGCPLREQCQSKEQAKECVVRIDLKSLRASRERERIEKNKVENTGKRAGIEGTNSALKRTGHNKLKVRGAAKTTVVSGIKVTVQNIKRFIKFKQGGYKPKNVPEPKRGIPAPIYS
jgi:hypothetical protein